MIWSSLLTLSFNFLQNYCQYNWLVIDKLCWLLANYFMTKMIWFANYFIVACLFSNTQWFLFDYLLLFEDQFLFYSENSLITASIFTWPSPRGPRPRQQCLPRPHHPCGHSPVHADTPTLTAHADLVVAKRCRGPESATWRTQPSSTARSTAHQLPLQLQIPRPWGGLDDYFVY